MAAAMPYRRIMTISKNKLLTAGAVGALLLGAIWAGQPSAGADAAMSPLELAQVTRANCQVLLAHATSSAQRTRASQCIADQGVIIAALSPSPSASVSASATPSPSASSSPPPTPTPTATTPPPSGCSVSDTNVPGGADPWGGCWPGPGNTGVPAGTVLSAYGGPCIITVANTLIEAMTVTCPTLDIQAPGVIIRRSMLQGVDVTDANAANASFRVEDSTVVNGARDDCSCIGGHDFTVLRVEIRGGNRSAYCVLRCVIQDSWLHGQQLQGAQHGSGLREEQFTTARHNALVCDYPIVNDATGLGCSADLTGYPDFAPIHDNTIDRNLVLASITSSVCVYGGATNGKPFSGDSLNATNQRFTDNVFQRGSNGMCGYYGPVMDFAVGRAGNVWSGNVWADGGVVAPA